MTRVHDMGGRFGDGAIDPDPEDAPIFAENWHARALAVTLAAGALGQWNIDMSRHQREKLAPKDYARFSYYEKWMAGLVDLLVESGVLTAEDLSETVEARHPLAEKRLTPDRVAAVLSAGGPSARQSDIVPQFQPGDRVQTRYRAENATVPGGHTRLPAYAAGATGTVLLSHGAHVFPDKSAHRQGEAPEPLYTVVFPASELWRAPEHPNDEVTLDLWQSYLAPA